MIFSMGILLSGTASTYPVDAAKQWGSYLQHRSLLELENTPISSHLDIRNAKQHLENIRAILNPSMSDLATLLDVSRQSIYKWLSQSSFPEAEKFENIKNLSVIADMFKYEGVKRAEVLLNMKSSSGMSLFELLKAKQPYEEHLKLLITEAKAMEASHKQMRKFESKALPTNDWKSSISIPGYQEDL